jgi:hypothetical protein
MKSDMAMMMNIAAGVSCLAFSGCERKVDESAWWDGERERVELESQLTLLKYRHGSTDPAAAGDLAGMTVETARLARMKERLALGKVRLLTEISSMEDALSGPDGDRLKWVREAAIGMQFEILTAANGRTFEHARVVRIEDGGVSIRHDHGAATLKYGDLTPQQRNEFGLEAGSAMAAENRSAKQQAEYERWMEQELAAAGERRDTSAAREAAENERALRLQAAAVAEAEANDQERPLARAATPFGSGSIWRNSWYGDYNYGYNCGYGYRDRRRTVTYYTPATSYTPSYQPSPCRSSAYRSWQGSAAGRTVGPSRNANSMGESP